MMPPPTYPNGRPTTPRAKNTARTVIADDAPSEGSDEPRRTIEPARRATNHVCREDANALTATNVACGKRQSNIAMVWQIAIQCPKQK
jgi:hypothetical protein